MPIRATGSLANIHASLLVAWDATRDPRVGDLCEHVATARLGEEPREPLSASKKKVDLAAWRAVDEIGDALDFARLAAAARGGLQEDVERQVLALVRRGDPALARALLALLEKPPYAGVRSRDLCGTILDALEATRDRRAAEPARELGGRYLMIVKSGTGGWISTRLGEVAASLAAAPIATLSAADTDACETLAAALGVAAPTPIADGGKRTIAELLTEVYAAPDDDGPRQVYADALLERGEPRGEWIALDLSRAWGTLGDEGTARLNELAPSNQLAVWAQPLGNGGDVQFERGFPARIRLYRSAKSIIGAPAFSTIRCVSGIENVAQATTLALLDHPTAAHVREVETFSPQLLERMCARPRPWTHVKIVGARMPARSAFDNLPALSHLEVRLEGETSPPADLIAALPIRSASLDLRVMPPDLVVPKTLESFALKVPRLTALSLANHIALEHVRLDCNEALGRCSLPSLRRLELRSWGGGYPAVTCTGAIPKVEIEGGPLAPSSLEPFAATTHLTLKLRGDLVPGVLAPLRDVQRLTVSCWRMHDSLAELHALAHLEIHGRPEQPPIFGGPIETLRWHIPLAWVPSSLPLRVAKLETSAHAADIVAFLVRFPKLETLELYVVADKGIPLDDVPAWVTAVRASAIQHFVLRYGRSEITIRNGAVDANHDDELVSAVRAAASS